MLAYTAGIPVVQQVCRITQARSTALYTTPADLCEQHSPRTVSACCQKFHPKEQHAEDSCCDTEVKLTKAPDYVTQSTAQLPVVYLPVAFVVNILGLPLPQHQRSGICLYTRPPPPGWTDNRQAYHAVWRI